MSIVKNQLHAELSVFTLAVRSQVGAAKLAASDGNRPYAQKLLRKELARIKDRQQRPRWYTVAVELFNLRLAVEAVGKKLHVAVG